MSFCYSDLAAIYNDLAPKGLRVFDSMGVVEVSAGATSTIGATKLVLLLGGKFSSVRGRPVDGFC